MSKIIYLSYTYLPHMEGGALYTHIIAKNAVENGYAVEIITRKRDNINTLLVGTTKKNIKVRYIDKFQFKFGKFYRVIDKILIYNILLSKEKLCDTKLIHCISTNFFFPSVYYLKKKYDVPIVISIAEDLWNKPQSSLLAKTFFKYQKWQLKIALKHSDVITVPNETGFKYLNKKYPEYAQKLKLIPGFIEMDIFNLSIDADDLKKTYAKHIIILVPQRLVLNKGVDIAIKALVPVVKKFPDVKMLIAGKGPLEKTLRNIVNELNLISYVEFLGELDHYIELPKYYALADIIIVPSRSEAGQPPNSAAEPMAMEKPVIISEACDIKGVLGSSVIRFKTGDVNDLSSKIIYLLENPDIAKKLGKKARKTILERYSISNFLNAYDEIYDSLLR